MVLFVFEAQTFIFAVLYQKTNHFYQKCCTVQRKKQRKHMFLDQWPWMLVPASLASGQWSRNIVFFSLFFWYSTTLLLEMFGSFGTVQQKRT